MLRRKKVLTNINKEKIILADQPLPNAKRFLFGEDFPSVVSKQAERSRGLGKNLSNAQKPKQSFQKSGITKDRQRPKTTGNFSKYQINQPKKLSVLSPQQGLLKTKTQQLLREVEGNNFRPRNLTCCVGMSNPFPLCTCSVTFSSSKMFRFNSSPCICRSEQTPVNRQYPFQKKISTADCSSSQKRRKTYRPVIDLSPLNRFVENFHFQMENISCLKTLLRRGDFMTCIDLKDAYLSVHVHKSSQKYLCFQWRNTSYAFQSLPFGLNTAPRVFTKLNKTHSSLLAEKRYSNNRIPGRLPNPELLHKRVESKHSTNTRSSAVARFHHKLGEVHASSYSLIDISGPLHRFADNVAQSP